MNMHVGGATKFKVGDLVKCVKSYPGEFTSGNFYTVAYYDPHGVARIGVTEDDSGTPNGIPAYCFEPAPLYAVGDKVRLRTADKWGELGVGEVVSLKSGDNNDRIGVVYPGDRFEWSFAPTELEPAAPKFKVGDKVRFTDKCAKFWWFGPHTAHKQGVISSTEGGSYQYKVDVDGESWPASVDAEHLELVAVAPATATTALRLESGKFYKTRDGRKVGPMRVGTFGAWDKSRTYTGMGWEFDGTFIKGCESSLDLIAEWPADPVVAEATTAKFKVGDRVEFRDDYGSDARGKAAVVVDVPPSSWGIQVRQIGNGEVSTESPSSLVPLPAAPTSIADIVRKHSGTAVVMLIENGQPKPSTLPYVHYDRSGAVKEANRLAGVHTGGEFGVYECVDVRKVEKPAVVYDFDWQRLAASGQKIAAIKELRRIAGLGLATSKSAVERFEREAA